MNLFDNNYDLNKGQFKLPIYKPPTISEVDTRDLKTLEKIPMTNLCLRISVPRDDISKMKPMPDTNPAAYVVPYIHLGGPKTAV